MSNSAGQIGYQKTIIVNSLPLYLNEPINLFPEQELKLRDFIIGGPRSQVYEMGKKIVKGNFSFPLTVDDSGSLDPAAQMLIDNAQYPLNGLSIYSNYVLAKRYITADPFDWSGSASPNTGFGIYQRMLFENCAITKMEITAKEMGNVSANVEIIGMVSTSTSSIPLLPATGMMKRSISYAECDISINSPAYHWDTSRNFSVIIENIIEPIYQFTHVADRSTWTDQPSVIAMGASHVTGNISYAVDRSTAWQEQMGLPSGSWIGSDLSFDISGICNINIPRIIANLTQQPIELGLLVRKTEFVALFRKTILDNLEGRFITFT